MVRPGKAAGPEARRLKTKIAAILLDHGVRGDLGSPKYTVRRLIDGLLFCNSLLGELVGFVELPSRFMFDQRKRVGGISIHLIGRGEDERSVRTELPRSFQQIGRAS